MVSLQVAEAAAAAGGRVIAGDPSGRLAGAAIDSRAVRGGELFFAFSGSRTDGHRFVADALARGAGGAVIESTERLGEARPEEAGGAHGRRRSPALIQVGSTLAALQEVARSVRQRVPERLVAVTGSVGKTTTKELLAAMLGARFRVARSPGNLNNSIGFPLALLNVPDDTQWMVAEMGMSTPGELRQLSLLGRPDVALFTAVRAVHLEFFGSLKAIAEAKAELLAGLPAGGLVVANAGDPEVVRIARRHLAAARGRVVWYGLDHVRHVRHFRDVRHARDVRDARSSADRGGIELDLWAHDLAPLFPEGSRFRLTAASGESEELLLPLYGLYNVENCLAAAACAHALGVPLVEIAAAVRGSSAAARRGVVHRVELPGERGGGFTLVDDSYNSNPDALAKALAAAALPPAARRLAVLGDMLELGPEAPRFHRAGGELAARLGFAVVAGVGELARELVAGANAPDTAAAPATIWFADAAAAAEWAAGAVRGGDLVLVKGSRGVGLEAVVRRLLEVAG
ncbi:MAG TPA: UDP-N-acetylmuramoyl-tripeptide--D-alanyl-D-alanine ligase [Thermoanaerobaculia bacterium]|nr:UDP-N-acetylmuramoyl-tripeptide--D-alanyl-D-alanine ligase [Thermoanaerobaculia bacterium]